MRFPLSLGVALLLCSLGMPAQAKPNVIFLFADDMRFDSVGALGNPTVKTPNLDALANRGFILRNAYCFGGNSGAVCTPSRNMLLTGNAYFRWKDFTPPGGPPGRKGAIAPGTGPNVPLSFKDAGYLTYHHGKRGNTATLVQARFDINKYLNNDEAERLSGEPGKEIVDSAIAFWQAKQDTQPVFMYLAFGNPHDPRVAAETYRKQYDPDKIPLPKNWLPVHPFDNGDLLVRDEQLLPWPRTEARLKQTYQDYYATITALDSHIGRLIQTLKNLQQYDNTIFVFAADQGVAIGSHGLLGKQNLYDHSMKCPLFLAGPGIPKGESPALLYLFDIYPTLSDLVGAKPPETIDGRSFRPVIEGKARSIRNEMMLAYLGNIRAYRDDRWKLLRYPRVDKTQLFDLQADPDEMKNLADEPSQQSRKQEMLARLAALQKQYGDDLSLTVENPAPAVEITPEYLRSRSKKPPKK